MKFLIGIIFSIFSQQLLAKDTLHIAVASNFSAPIKEIVQKFENSNNVKVVVTLGSSGKLFAQITHGAPFELFLSADEDRPKELEKTKFFVANTRTSYAIGQLALWSTLPNYIDQTQKILNDTKFKHLAIANPKLAPYGKAAIQTMQKLNVWTNIEKRVVQGENIAQTFQFVESKNAELGFVALSQILSLKEEKRGTYWTVPASLHEPIRQQMIMIKETPAARKFYEFMQTKEIHTIIMKHGYLVENI